MYAGRGTGAGSGTAPPAGNGRQFGSAVARQRAQCSMNSAMQGTVKSLAQAIWCVCWVRSKCLGDGISTLGMFQVLLNFLANSSSGWDASDVRATW